MKFKVDARLFVLSNHLTLITLGTLMYGLQRTKEQIFFAFFCGLLSELLFSRWIQKNHNSPSIKDRLISAATACAGTLVLLKSHIWWFYGFISLIAVASKYLILNEKSGHVFNPTNFAIVFVLAFLPGNINLQPDEFSLSRVLIGVILLFGTLAIVYGRRWRLTIGYYIGVIFIGIPTGYFLGYQPLWVLGPEINTNMMIFASLMITDPRTTPSESKLQWLTGCLVAVLHLFLRHHQIPYSSFLALFVFTGLRSAGVRKVGVPIDSYHRTWKLGHEPNVVEN